MRRVTPCQATRVLDIHLNQIQILIVHIETMNWTGVLPRFNLFLVSTPDHPGPTEHPHSALLPHQSRFPRQSPFKTVSEPSSWAIYFSPRHSLLRSPR